MNHRLPFLGVGLDELSELGGREQQRRRTELGAFNHAGIQVEATADVLAAKERLVAAGLAAFDEMDTTCCYARQDKIWVRDPDGTPWEVFAAHEDTEQPGADPQDHVIFTIDDDVCTRCALCVDRCPTGVIILGKVGDAPADGDPHQRTNAHGYSYGMRLG